MAPPRTVAIDPWILSSIAASQPLVRGSHTPTCRTYLPCCSGSYIRACDRIHWAMQCQSPTLPRSSRATRYQVLMILAAANPGVPLKPLLARGTAYRKRRHKKVRMVGAKQPSIPALPTGHAFLIPVYGPNGSSGMNEWPCRPIDGSRPLDVLLEPVKTGGTPAYYTPLLFQGLGRSLPPPYPCTYTPPRSLWHTTSRHAAAHLCLSRPSLLRYALAAFLYARPMSAANATLQSRVPPPSLPMQNMHGLLPPSLRGATYAHSAAAP